MYRAPDSVTSKRVGVVSLFGRSNYGNCLQRRAVHELTQQLGFEAVSFDLRPVSRSLIRDQCLTALSCLPKRGRLAERLRRFREFDQRILVKRIPRRAMSRFAEGLEAVIAGSDQVWNPRFWGFDPYINLLEFVAENKRITFAPSFGVATLESVEEEVFRSGLSGFQRVSTREPSGAAIVRELLSIECEVIADPTLVIGYSYWRNHTDESFVPDQPYVLCYELGEGSNCVTRAAEFAATHGCQVVELNNPTNGYFSCGPADFIGLIFGARTVFTDSFHAAIFSVMGHVPFEVVERRGSNFSMSSRFDTITEKFGVALNDPNQDYQWGRVDLLLQETAEEGFRFLHEELERAGREDATVAE